MKKATLAQRDKLWKVVQQERTPREQLQAVLASGLFSDLLNANFNQPINRTEFRRLLGISNKGSAGELPLIHLIRKCSARLRHIIEYNFPNARTQTIGDFVEYAETKSIGMLKNSGGSTILEAKRVLKEEFGIELQLTPKDEEWADRYLARRVIPDMADEAVLSEAKNFPSNGVPFLVE